MTGSPLSLFFARVENGLETTSWRAKVISFAGALFLLAFVLTVSFTALRYNWNWDAVWAYRQKFINGWIVTVLLSLAALVLSTLIGLVFALGQRSSFLPVRYFSKIYVELVRGTPLLVQIFILFYVVGNLFGLTERYTSGVLILSLFSGAYISEVIRAGIENVGKSQIESARAIGLTRVQTYRYVIFPQAIRQILPPLTGQFVSLIKDSSLLSVISIAEFTKEAQEVASITYGTLESYLPLAVGYLALTLPLALWTRAMEKRFRYET